MSDNVCQGPAVGAHNQPQSARDLSTPEFIRLVPVSRSIFFRLRCQYPAVLKPTRTVGMVHFWEPALLETVRSILAQEVSR